MSRTRTDGETAVRVFAAGYRCPDCNSKATLHRLDVGIYQLAVEHDETCPLLARLDQR